MLGLLLGIGSALIKGSSAKKAAKTQAKSGREALSFQRDKFEAGYGALEPFRMAGQTGLDAYRFEMGLGDRPEGYGGFKESESFKSILGAGRDTIEAGAAKAGKLFSGATGTALEKFRMGLASSEVNTFLNRLSGLGSMGAQAASAQAGVGTQFANMGSQTIQGIGNVQAAGQVGVGNAIAGGIDTGLGAYGFLNNVDRPNGPGFMDPNFKIFGGNSWG